MQVVNSPGSNTAQRSAFRFQHKGRDRAIACVSVCDKTKKLTTCFIGLGPPTSALRWGARSKAVMLPWAAGDSATGLGRFADAPTSSTRTLETPIRDKAGCDTGSGPSVVPRLHAGNDNKECRISFHKSL